MSKHLLIWHSTLVAAVAVALALPSIGTSAPFYSNDFEVDTSASWTVNNGPSDEAHDFYFDYSTVGIPSAPNSAAGTSRGMKLQANLSNATFSGMSVSPNGQNFSGDYVVKFDWWANFNGPFPGGGSGSTNLSTFGVGTAGSSAQWPGGAWDSVFFGATGDGGSSSDWRAYSNGSGGAAGAIWPETSGVYAAGNVAGVTNASNQFYADEGFGDNVAPAAQLLAFPQQSGNTAVGTAGMEWHQVEIAKTSQIVKWTVDGTVIATIPLSPDVTMGGGNILFGHSDINASSSNDANDAALLFTLIDNVRVVPEPGAFAIAVVALMGLVGLRHRS